MENETDPALRLARETSNTGLHRLSPNGHRELAAPLVDAVRQLSPIEPMSTAPKDGSWIILYGTEYGQPKVTAALWSDTDPPGWYNSESASRRVTDWGWEPDAWGPLPSSVSI